MMAMDGRGWSDTELETLKSMWLDGASATRIANALPGRTRSAVLGKVHRLKEIPKRVSTMARSRAKTGFKPKLAPVALDKILPRDQLKPADPPIYTRDLEDAHCRFPYDDPRAPDGAGYKYCGLKRSGASLYCDSHNVIVYNKQAAKDLDNAG